MFNFDGPISKFLCKVCDILILNLVWAFCSLPIFTVGASTTALYYTFLKVIKDEESYIVQDFFKSFKENFKQATIIWIILLIFGLILGTGILNSLKLWLITGDQFSLISLYFICFIGILYCMVLLYIFPLVSKFENTTKILLKLSLLLAIKHLLWTIVMFGVIIIGLLLSYVVPFVATFFVGITAFINSLLFNHIFQKYNIKKDEENKNEIIEE